MTLQKITVDNGSKNIPQGEQNRENKQSTIKNNSNPREQLKKFTKKFKKNR